VRTVKLNWLNWTITRLAQQDIHRERQLKTFEAIHHEAVDSIITIDERGIVQSVNPATLEMFGFGQSELVGRNVNQLMPEPVRSEHDGYLVNYINTGVQKIIGIGREVIAKRKNGSTFPAHLAVSEIRVFGERLFVGIVRDLTELKSLEADETALGRIIEESVNEVYICELPTLRFNLVNRGGRSNLGYALEQLQEMSLADVVYGFSESQFRDKLSPLLSGRVSHLEFTSALRRADGTIYEISANLQVTTYKNTPALVAFVLDITERRNAERALQAQQENMQAELSQLVHERTKELKKAQAELVQNEKFSTLGKVSGGIAHEIRNPLNAVKTSAYYLLNARQPPPEKIREHLERIDRQVSLIDSVVTALSDVAKLPTANLKPLDLRPFIKTAVSSVNIPPSIKIEYDFPADLPDVWVDENQILIAIKNLVRNARDAMPDGGTLKIAAEINDEQVFYTFSDSGVGIAPEHLEKILEPLFTTKARGMGLGLSITRAIAEKNCCLLTIESELGKGSRFGIGISRSNPLQNK
jgi:two-component system, LuxR family, sensor kinase FixL